MRLVVTRSFVRHAASTVARRSGTPVRGWFTLGALPTERWPLRAALRCTARAAPGGRDGSGAGSGVAPRSLQQSRVVLAIHPGMRGAIGRCLQLGDEGIEPRREDDEIAGILRLVGVRDSGRDEYAAARRDIDVPIREAKAQAPLEDVPRLVIGGMAVQRGAA